MRQALGLGTPSAQAFFTRQGASKRDGAARLAAELGIKLAHSLGVGDASTDDFLADVGLASLMPFVRGAS